MKKLKSSSNPEAKTSKQQNPFLGSLKAVPLFVYLINIIACRHYTAEEVVLFLKLCSLKTTAHSEGPFPQHPPLIDVIFWPPDSKVFFAL